MKAKIGDRIELISMRDDPDPIEPGTNGIVNFVNDNPALGFIQYGVLWDNGRTLMLCVPPDTFKVLDQAASATEDRAEED
jgi:hypothetical protein